MSGKANSKGKMILFTAPSGAGKTTIVRHLLKRFPECLAFSVSATTRPKRKHETDGKDYYFLSQNAFLKKIKEDAFAEWEEVYPHKYYGTLKSEIERLWKEGKTILFDIDVKGASRLKKRYGKQALAVFVSPPSIEELEARLSGRKTETSASIRERIQRALKEMEYRSQFDRVLVNDQLEMALAEAEQIVVQWAKCPDNSQSLNTHA